jgi:hypothetical protein
VDQLNYSDYASDGEAQAKPEFKASLSKHKTPLNKSCLNNSFSRARDYGNMLER